VYVVKRQGPIRTRHNPLRTPFAITKVAEPVARHKLQPCHTVRFGYRRVKVTSIMPHAQRHYLFYRVPTEIHLPSPSSVSYSWKMPLPTPSTLQTLTSSLVHGPLVYLLWSLSLLREIRIASFEVSSRRSQSQPLGPNTLAWSATPPSAWPRHGQKFSSSHRVLR
jgi:hypothetical protein